MAATVGAESPGAASVEAWKDDAVQLRVQLPKAEANRR